MNPVLAQGRHLPKRIFCYFLRESSRRLPVTSHYWGSPRGIFPRTAEWCQTYSGSEFLSLAPSQDTTLPLPLAFEEFNEEYRRLLNRNTPERFVAAIPRGRACYQGLVLTPDDYILEDISYVVLAANKNKQRLPILDSAKLPRLRKESGTIAVISGPWPDNYYHWMFDILPRIHLLQESGLKIDKYIVNCTHKFQYQSLELLGITPQMCIADSVNLHLQAEKLVVASLPGGQGNPPRWACDFLREKLLGPILQTKRNNFLSTPQAELGRKLYISRADAPGRRVTNEDEVLGILKPKGFRSITLDGLSVHEQALLFHNAQAIVAPHGAALTNLVFCRPGTPVIELFTSGWTYPIYNFISAHCDLRLGCLFGQGERPLPANSGQHYQEDMTVNIAELEAMLKKLEL